MKGRFVLCYVRDPWAYFTTQELSKQWGDDWNDAPYEHNAGDPYAYRETVYDDGQMVPNPLPRYEIMKVAWAGPLEEPCSWARSSTLSVEMVNRGVVPWLQTDRYSLSDTPMVRIWAGTTYPEFLQLMQEVGATVYVPVEIK